MVLPAIPITLTSYYSSDPNKFASIFPNFFNSLLLRFSDWSMHDSFAFLTLNLLDLEANHYNFAQIVQHFRLAISAQFARLCLEDWNFANVAQYSNCKTALRRAGGRCGTNIAFCSSLPPGVSLCFKVFSIDLLCPATVSSRTSLKHTNAQHNGQHLGAQSTQKFDESIPVSQTNIDQAVR
jgi:hypothetical protein